MKRLIVALMVGGVLFTAAWGAAAALNVTANALQAGSDEVLIATPTGCRSPTRTAGIARPTTSQSPPSWSEGLTAPATACYSKSCSRIQTATGLLAERSLGSLAVPTRLCP